MSGPSTSAGSTTTGPIVTTVGPSSTGPGSDSTDTFEPGESSGSSSTGLLEPPGPTGLVMFEGGLGDDFVTVSIPEGDIESLGGGLFMLALDRQHIMRSAGNPEGGVTREVFETSDLAAGLVTTFSRPESWQDIVFIGPSFVVGELAGGGFERVALDGTSPAPYAMLEYPSLPMLSHDGDVVSGCIQGDAESTLHQWRVEEDGLLEQWSTPLEMEDCPSALGMARDGSAFVATTTGGSFDRCHSFGPDGAIIASEDFLPGVIRRLGPAAEDDALLFGSSDDPLQAYVLGADCTLDLLQSPDAAIAFARLNDAGVFFAAISGQGNAMLEFGRFDVLDEVTRVRLGGVVSSTNPPAYVDVQ